VVNNREEGTIGRMKNPRYNNEMSNITKQLILAFVDDFFFIPQIESRLSSIYELKFVESTNSNIDELILEFSPDLFLIDMNHRSFDWATKIGDKTENNPFSVRPKLMFGSHKDVNSFKLAKSIGVDLIVAKSRFVSDMENLVSKLLSEHA
jgi:hypothetical protein